MVRHKKLSIVFLNSCKKYEFNNENLKNTLYRKSNAIKKEIKKHKKVEEKNEKKKNIFIPEEEDTLFWCYIINKYGYSEYELKREKKYESITNLKIDLVYTLRDNKELLKKYKLKKTKLEENLTSEKKISLDTFLFLMRVNNYNIIYFTENTYFEEYNSDEEKKCIIKYEKEEDKYGILEITDEKIEELKSNKLHILNMSKPLKALSGYKVLELKEICKTLNINAMKTSTITNNDYNCNCD